VLAYVMARFGLFALMKKFVFFLAWKEACFRFRKMTMAEVTWQLWRYVEFICNSRSLAKPGTLFRPRWWKFVLVKCWLVVQQRCKYVILAPLQSYSAR